MSFAHSIWLDDDEVKIMAGSPTPWSCTTVSNMKLGTGRAPIPTMLKRAGSKIALGSDGAPPSADGRNMFETIKGAAVAHRPSHEQEDWIEAGEALEMCWRGGGAAYANRSANSKPATTPTSRSSTPAACSSRRGSSSRARSSIASWGSVDSVVIGGEVVLDNGRFTSIDEAEIHREAQEIVNRLYAGLPERMARFEAGAAAFPRAGAEGLSNPTLPFNRYCQ